MDKFTFKRLKQIIENEEKRFGGVPNGHYEKTHIEAKKREQEFLKKRIKKNEQKIKETKKE